MAEVPYRIAKLIEAASSVADDEFAACLDRDTARSSRLTSEIARQTAKQ
jgi:ABC-type ATPase with predicted acetyltransferase domain